MTNGQLTRANELQKHITVAENMTRDLQNGYMNTIVAYSSNTGRNSSINFSNGDELYTLILDYFKRQLESMQQEFDDL